MRIPLALAFLAFAAPSLAAETPWQEVAPGVRLRLIADNVLNPDGTTLLGLEVDMPPGYKTYWRVPGETGIPTELDFAGSRGVGGHAMIWPYPVIDQTGGFTDFVYRGLTVLPVQLTVDAASAEIKAAVTMGVCSDICVPALARFELPLDFAKPDRSQGLRLAQAVALAPGVWDDPREPFLAVAYDATANALSLQLGDAGVDPASLIADVEGGAQLFGAPQKSPDTNLVLLPLLGGGGEGLVGKPVEITFMTNQGPFAVSRQVLPLR